MKLKYYNRITSCCMFFMTLALCFAIRPIQSQVSVEATTGITTEFSGLVKVECMGHWLCQGDMIPGTSTISLTGPHLQSLGQDEGAFTNLTIDKSAGEVTILSNVTVNGGVLSILHQDLSLNGHIITLEPTAMLSETAGQTIKGPTGYLTTTRMLSAPGGTNIAGMGLSIMSAGDFGLTEIRRGHAAQPANGHEGILRYFDVFPEFNGVSDATLQLRYDESELNGNAEAQLKLYHSPDGGVNWIEVAGILNETDNRFDAPAVSSLSRFTLSSYCLETCIATEAVTKPAIVYLNAGGLGSLEPADINGGSKGACGIDSMHVLPEAFTCADIGMQEVWLVVTDNNGCTKSAIALVDIADAIPPVVECKNLTVSVGESCDATITAGDIDNGSSDACGITMEIDVSIFDCDDLGPNPVILTVMDPSGNTATCEAVVTVEMEINVECQDGMFSLNEDGVVIIDPFDLITGDPESYAGYTFTVEPNTFSCEELGEHQVALTSTDPFGEVTICEVTVTIFGPDADCDGVADLCDVCDGGDDLLDTDSDGIPDCADWDGWANLIEEWQCASNKVFLCHEGIVICVNQNAVQAHLDHGDFMGSCDAVFCDDPPALQTALLHEGINRSEEHRIDALPLADQVLSNPEVLEEVVVENRPNPFFPETTIRFYLPQQDWIYLVVYDMMGSQVMLLAQGTFDAGWQEVVFDGTDHPDGVYIYMLRTARHCKTGAMVLAR